MPQQESHSPCPPESGKRPTGRWCNILNLLVLVALCTLGVSVYSIRSTLPSAVENGAADPAKDAEKFFFQARVCYSRKTLQDKLEAADWFRKAARLGHASAQYWLGRMYAEADGLSRDMELAAHWFRKAAEQGEADAQYRLGIMYADGDGLPQDTAQALEWLRKAGEQGVAEAWYRLSVMYNTGLGLPQKKELSRDSLRETIRERKAVAAYDAGISKYKGRGTLLDPEGGLRLLREAARLGHPKAPEILVEAALFRAWDVAKYGDAEAKYRLASRFFLGKDMPADKGKAFDWYSQAAELGYAAAQYLLGVAFYEGVDLAKDLVRARYWLEKAACQGYAGADAALERFRLEHPREYEEAAKFRRILGSYYQLVQQARNGDKQARRLLERFSFR